MRISALSGLRFKDLALYLSGQITQEEFKFRRIKNQPNKFWLRDYEGK